jgi:ribonuclease HI
MLTINMTKIIAFTDGSCTNNGQPEKEQLAGIGVYYPGHHSHNLSESLPFKKKTNNRAEMYAIIRCLENIIENPVGLPIKSNTVIVVKSDSLLCVNSITKWRHKWKANGWKKDKQKSPENLDLLIRLDVLLGLFPLKVVFEHVRGHTKEPKDKKSEEWLNWFGNMNSDKFAEDARA